MITLGFCGGISGVLHRQSIIKNSYNGGLIQNQGGITGGIAGTQTRGATIINCYNYGNMYCGESYNEVSGAGIAGTFKGDSNYGIGKIKYCYNVGRISSTKSSNKLHFGGICAVINDGNVEINYCYNVGVFDYSISSANNYIGGLLGGIYSSTSVTISNLYTLYSNIIGYNYSNVSTTNVNSNYSNMPTVLSVMNSGGQSAFKADYTGNNSINNGYPILNWQ